MEFNSQNCPAIKKACASEQAISFYAPKDATCFANSEAPDDWTPYPLASLEKDAYAQIYVHAGNDARGALIKLELTVHLLGGKIEYKKRDKKTVDLRVSFT